MTADGEGGGEKSKFRWLDAARYAVAAAVTVLIMAVIVNAVKVVLRPDSLQLSVDKGSIFTAQYPPQLIMELKLRAQNPSGRVRMYYVGVTGYLFDNTTSASASLDPGYDSVVIFKPKDMAVVQQEALDCSLGMKVVREKQMDPSHFDVLYNGSSFSDMTLRLDGDLITEVTSELNMTRRTTYYCEELLVGGNGDDEAFNDPATQRHLGPVVPPSRAVRSPPAASTCAAKARPPPSLADLLRQDQLRVDHIHRRLSSSSEGVRVSKQAGPVKEPVRSEVIHLHDQPVIQVTIGSERKTSAGGGRGGVGGQQSQAAGVVQTVVLDTASDVPWYRVPIPSSPALSSSSGTYGSDLLALAADPANGALSFKFGCSHAEAKQGEEGSLNNATAGVMALGGGPESLVSQTTATYGSAFSYCIPATESRQPGFFVLGGSGDPSAGARYVVTPLLRYARVPTFYRVRLLAIAVDGQQLNVTPSVFAAGSVLDSRTAITRLPPTQYQKLREAFRSRMAM
ncbi:unnamed protein product [Miscanthus lutarioriparius]|uniref:Peptidase A1 domain-containing protein n=1 Tax=Miscanthus lutarioriparius TaxID=422564 RepID=A0A811S666_9POAL|nr:unnamed protein product [Miscanthus lutarioriparius]